MHCLLKNVKICATYRMINVEIRRTRRQTEFFTETFDSTQGQHQSDGGTESEEIFRLELEMRISDNLDADPGTSGIVSDRGCAGG